MYADNLRHARDLASQLCVYYKGKKVVDLYGIGEKSEDKKYNADSLQVVFSSSKVVIAIVVAWMVDKGYLSYDERIAHYWVGLSFSVFWTCLSNRCCLFSLNLRRMGRKTSHLLS